MFIIKLYWYIYGYYLIKVTGKKSEQFINGLIFHNIKFWDVEKDDSNGELKLKIKKRQYKAELFGRILAKSGNENYTVSEQGVKKIFDRYKKRLGIYVGVFLGVALIYTSTLFVWEVRVSDGESINKQQVTEILSELGCKVGMLKKSIDVVDIQNKFLIRDKDISWIAINIKGTVANIEIRKNLEPVKIMEKDKPVNIIAKKSGKIVYIDTYQGQQIAQEGFTVKKGDLLISGIMDSNAVGIRIKHAMGKVIARTSRQLEVSVPFISEEAVFTGNSKTKNRYKVLGRSMLVSVDFSKDYEFFKRTDAEENITLFDKIVLPIIKTSEYFAEYTVNSKKITEEEAKIIANNKLNDIIYREFSDIEIVSREVEYEISESGLTLMCSLECFEDIAGESEFNSNISAK